MIEKVLVVLVGLLVSLGAEELPLSAELRKEFDLAEFYQQAIVVEGCFRLWLQRRWRQWQCGKRSG